MPERKDVPVPELATEIATNDDLQAIEMQPRWRRPTLLLGGSSLLLLGVLLNVERFDSDQLLAAEIDLEGELEEEPPPAEIDDSAGGSGTRHRGEEGKMGKPSSRSKSGMYAMRGPNHAVPQLARNFDPLAGGGAYAIGNDDEDVWGGLTGTEVGEAYGAGGLGLVGAGHGGGGVGDADRRDSAAERYAEVVHNRFVPTAKDPKSTFSIDVDTASYANVRRFLLSDRQLPPAAAVRTEELINYFDYDYAQPTGDAPFSLTTEVGPCPWNADHRLVHVGVQGKIIAADQTPRRNLVFLLDVSGSMTDDDRLPLIKHGLAALTDQLDADDRVSIVVYAGAAGVVLPPTSGADKQAILGAMDRLQAGGSTNGGEGIELAYALAQQHFVEGGVNRVLLATDGDFNVGTSTHDELIDLIEAKRESGVFLSVLAVGTGNLNDHTMEQLADKGNGNYAYLDGMFEARKVLVAEAGGTLVTIAKDVKIQVEFDPDVVTEHRLVGYENRVMAHHEFDDDSKDAGEIGAGHSVTAIYEVALANGHDSGELMELDLRYKQPDGDHSRKLTVSVDDSTQSLGESSNDYRFAAAVAAFAEHLRGGQGPSYAEIAALATTALGADPHCYRHQFLELVASAAQLSGEPIDPLTSTCTPGEPTRVIGLDLDPVMVAVDHRSNHGGQLETEQPADDSQTWQAFVLEVLRLLPPFLALPMFFAALRRPRRNRV